MKIVNTFTDWLVGHIYYIVCINNCTGIKNHFSLRFFLTFYFLESWRRCFKKFYNGDNLPEVIMLTNTEINSVTEHHKESSNAN